MASRSRGCRHIVRCRMRNTHTHTCYILCKRPNVDKDEMAYAMDMKHSAHEVVCGVYAHTYVVYRRTHMWHIKHQREEDKMPVSQLAKQPKTGETGSSRTMITGQPREPSVQNLLVLPPMPVDIYEELTLLFDGLES